MNDGGRGGGPRDGDPDGMGGGGGGGVDGCKDGLFDLDEFCDDAVMVCGVVGRDAYGGVDLSSASSCPNKCRSQYSLCVS